MKKLLLKLALFSGLTLIVWLGVFVITLQSYGLEYSIFGKETNWGFTNLRSSEWGLQKELGNNVLFFGASTCYSGIDPSALSAFGLSGFNFCSSAQGIGNSAHLILPAISSQTPQAIIVDVCPEIWGAQAPYLESTKDWIINSNLRHLNGREHIGDWLLSPVISLHSSHHSTMISCENSRSPEPTHTLRKTLKEIIEGWVL